MTDTSFSGAVWTAAAAVRRDVEQHRFVLGLLDGTLPRRAFDHYVAQDAHYLAGYAVALQACAAQASGAAARDFWTGAARDTLAIEKSLHEGYLAGRPAPDRSPACAGYVSFLLDTAAAGTPAVLAAAVLPCFWLFSDLGRRCTTVDLAGHRYAAWVQTYRDPAFAAATDRARAIVDDLAASSPPVTRAAMADVFLVACRYERSLFDEAVAAAARGRLNGSARARATTNEVSEADSHG